MEENLGRKTFWGVLWSYVNRFGTQVIAIVPTMILARLISPSEYGLLAMTAVFTGVASQLADGGFGNALVQKNNADHLDFCSVFYFNLGICALVYIVFWFLAPFFASFFEEGRLVTIIRVTTLNILFGALGQIHSIIFKKEIDYKRPAVRDAFVQIVSAIIAVCMAFADYGVWALVMQGLSQTLLGSFFNWIISSWRPTLCFSFHRLKMLYSFGSKILIMSLINYIFDKGYDIIIGKFYSSSSLAYYNRGKSTASLFSDTFFGVFSGVTFPVFVKMQNDNERLRENIRKFIGVTSLVLFFVVMAIAIMATPLFRVMYSSKWDEAIPLFQLICISTLFLPIISILESILWAKGESGMILFLSVVQKIYVVTAILLTWHYGIACMIIGQIVCKIIDVVCLVLLSREMVNYGFCNLFSDIWKNLILAIVSVLPACFLDMIFLHIIWNGTNDFVISLMRLLLGFLIASATFITLNKYIGLRSYRDMFLFIKGSIGESKILEWLSPRF